MIMMHRIIDTSSSITGPASHTCRSLPQWDNVCIGKARHILDIAPHRCIVLTSMIMMHRIIDTSSSITGTAPHTCRSLPQ
jgi:hypothetical protein